MLRHSQAIPLVLGVVVGHALQSLGVPARVCDTYIIPSTSGGFTQQTFIDFSTVTPSSGSVASLLSSKGLSISGYTVQSTPVPHTFVPANVAFGSGFLDLKVSAYKGTGSVQSSEIVTQDTFKYASVRTVLKSSGVPGVVEGNFFYLNDNQETDFEILTSTTLVPSAYVPAGIWATNQALVPGTSATFKTIPFTFDPSKDFHEYRIDWSINGTVFYIDGVQKARLTTNVPTKDGRWVWNAYSKGSPFWSNGPPTADSFTHIRSIEIYKGFTATPKGSLCSV